MKPSKVLRLGSDKTDKSFEFTADMLAGIFTWGGIGWLLDRLLDTQPVLMLIGFVVGNMASLYLLYIRTQEPGPVRMDASPPDNPQSHTDTERP